MSRALAVVHLKAAALPAVCLCILRGPWIFSSPDSIVPVARCCLMAGYDHAVTVLESLHSGLPQSM